MIKFILIISAATLLNNDIRVAFGGHSGPTFDAIRRYDADMGAYLPDAGRWEAVPPDDVPVVPIDPVCQALINNFTDASTNYTCCILQNAMTFKRCQLCIGEYLQVGKTYRSLMHTPKNLTNRCTEVYPGMGEVQVFRNVNHFVENNWKDGGCQNCFAWFTINLTYTAQLSNNTQTVLALLLDFYSCVFNDSFVSTTQFQIVNALHLLPTETNNTNVTVCKRCKNQYRELNDFYFANFESLLNKDKDIVICADLNDSMNFTRYVWQEVYNCSVDHVSVWPIVVASVVLCSLPVLFYAFTKIFGREVERNVVVQKRYRRRSENSSSTHLSTSGRGNNLT